MPEGNVFQEIQYENPPKDKSSARFSNGFIWSEPSPGTTNIVLADVLTNENKTFVYQNPINSQIVQKAENYVINYQNANQQNPQSGYQELAAVRQPSQNSKNNPLSLVLIIIAIVLGASIIGIILIKFRKKFP
jgi:multisubunit Na+/H+ antiporter MnhC subunit